MVFQRMKLKGYLPLIMAGNGSRLCEGKGLEALNFKLRTND